MKMQMSKKNKGEIDFQKRKKKELHGEKRDIS